MRTHVNENVRREGTPAFEALEPRLLLDGVTAPAGFPTDPPPGCDLVCPYDVNFSGSRITIPWD